jgi:hypothetical protein
MTHKSRKNSCFEVLDGLFLVIKALDPDWIRIRIGLHPDPLDPDPDPKKK